MLTFPPDSSFLIQIVLFILLWIGLKRLLFDPVMHVLEARDARTSGLNREAAAMKASAEQSAAEYERRMHEVRHQISAAAAAAARRRPHGRATTHRGSAPGGEQPIDAAARDARR